MKEDFKDYFHFTKGERNGIIVLLLVLFILIILPYLTPIFINTKPIYKDAFQDEIAYFNKYLIEVEKPYSNNRLNQNKINRYDSLKLFHFNPNEASDKDFKKLGLTVKQIKTINNYLSKGGKFYIKDDFRKIYGIRNQQYLLLKPYILLPTEKSANNKTVHNISPHQKDSLFVFDPNNTSEEKLLLLGFSTKQISTIKNYLEKIGPFESIQDFKKIYGISNEQFNRVKSYIKINTKKTQEENEATYILELNSSTIEELVKIKGIGVYTAKAIINYRKKLGGFTSTEQLLEIKKLNKDYFYKYKDGLTVDISKITKMSLNFFEIEDFVKHPYLDYKQAKEIVEFRTKNGPYKNVKQLLKENILIESTYNRTFHYFSTN